MAAWMIQALRGDFDVTLLTWTQIDLRRINLMFGTSLRETDFRIRTVPAALRAAIALDPDEGSIQKHAWLMRVAKRMRAGYDLAISADNEADLGLPALQYIHYPFLAHVYPRMCESPDLPLHAKLKAIAEGKLRPWMLLGNFSFERVKSTRTLVNSDWTGRWVKRVYGISSVTVSPPTSGVIPHAAWDKREDGFVMIGRFCEGKRIDWVIGVLQRVRDRFPHIRLHLFGGVDLASTGAEYFRRLTELVTQHASWIRLHVDLPRDEMFQIVSRQRYGIHALLEEHFGMAVAEMVAAGCIPFVHDSGGPPDIVGNDPRLRYSTEADAFEKIVRVLESPREQGDIRAALEGRRRAYTPEAFASSIRREVRDMLSIGVKS